MNIIFNFSNFFYKHLLLSLSWIISLLIFIFISLKNILYKYNEISCNKLIYLLNNKNAFIIDLRKEDDYNAGHIISSVNIQIESIKSKNLKNFVNRPIIIVSVINGKFLKLVKYLHSIGFKEIYSLKGGIYSWYKEKLPLVKNKQ